jgi:hypothetical protein
VHLMCPFAVRTPLCGAPESRARITATQLPLRPAPHSTLSVSSITLGSQSR